MSLLLGLAELCIVLQIGRGMTELVALGRWVRQRSATAAVPSSPRRFFYVLLPVLREQKVLRATVEDLLRQTYPHSHYQIVIITTEKERYEASRYTQAGPSTIEVASALAAELNTTAGQTRVRVMHYPETDGVMGHQVNYACQQLLAEGASPDSYMALYNADSRPALTTLTQADDQISRSAKPTVFQQLAFYTSNFDELDHKPPLERWLLKAAGVYQSVYTVCQEAPLIEAYAGSLDRPVPAHRLRRALTARLAYCIGHGMFVQLNQLRELGWLPVETTNEDLPFGFLLCSQRIAIRPLLTYEYAETPDSLGAIINQRSVWFWGYLDYPKALRMARERFGLERLTGLVLTARGLLRGAAWLGLSFIYGFPILVALFSHNRLLGSIVGLNLLAFQLLPSLAVLHRLRHQQIAEGQTPTTTRAELVLLPLAGLVMLLIDSLGPALATGRWLRRQLTGVAPEKRKTERAVATHSRL